MENGNISCLCTVIKACRAVRSFRHFSRSIIRILNIFVILCAFPDTDFLHITGKAFFKQIITSIGTYEWQRIVE